MSKLAKILSDRYHNAKVGEAVVSIHLFGIEFAKELEGESIAQLCSDASLSPPYRTEIRKGMRLAEFVELKK